MRRPGFCMALVFFLAVLLSGSPSAFAEGLIIHDGATFTLNGSTLDLNCLDLTVESGGTVDFSSGVVADCGNLIVDDISSLIWGTGIIHYCRNTTKAMPWLMLLLLDD